MLDDTNTMMMLALANSDHSYLTSRNGMAISILKQCWGFGLEASVGAVARNTKEAKKETQRKPAGRFSARRAWAGVFRVGAPRAKQVLLIR